MELLDTAQGVRLLASSSCIGLALLLLPVAACGDSADPDAGVDAAHVDSGFDAARVDSGFMCGTCGACAPAVQLTVDVEGATATRTDGSTPVELGCGNSSGTTVCEDYSVVTPGTYDYDVQAGGVTQSVTVVVEATGGTACCDCGYVSATRDVSFAADAGV